MSEWLTTGEMIDRLKVGEVAEGRFETSTEGFTFKIKRSETRLENLTNYDGHVALDNTFFNAKWHILPKYVTFEEAMKALKDGNEVCLLRANGEGMLRPFDKNMMIQNSDGVGRTFDSWFEGKWQIIE